MNVGRKLSDPSLVIGIDPSSGAKSAVGVSIIQPSLRRIIAYTELTCPKYLTVEQRLRKINQDLNSFLYSRCDSYNNSLIAIEYTIMASKSGETLNRAIGAIIAALPVENSEVSCRNVHNTTVKKLIAGFGGASKNEVALGLNQFFSTNQDSLNIINKLVQEQRYDILDSLAIGATGYLQFVNREPEPGAYKSKQK